MKYKLMPHACWLAHANSVRTSRGVAPSARRAAVDSSPLTSLRTLNAWMAKSSDVLPSTIHSWAANGLCSGAQRTALGRGVLPLRGPQRVTVRPRVRVRSQTIKSQLVQNLKGLDVLLAPRGYATGSAVARSAGERHC